MTSSSAPIAVAWQVMTNDTKHGKDTICSSDDTIRSCESETSLTSPGIVRAEDIGTLIRTLCGEVGIDKRDTAAATIDNCIDAVRCATHELFALVRDHGTDDGEVSLVDVVPLLAELLPARLRGRDSPLQMALAELKAIEEVVLRHRHAKDIDALGKLSSGASLDGVVWDLLRYPPLTMTDPAGVLSEIEKALLRTEGTAHSVPVKDLLCAGERLDGVAARVLNTLRRDADKAQAEVKVLTGSVDHWKAEAERWKGLSRQAQRERDDWQAQQAKAESESTKRMLERDVLGDKFADALGIPHRTLFAAGELRYGRPLPDGYKDEADHPLVVRLAEVLTGRPMGTELPESIVARATAEVLSWMDAPKVPVVRLPPMLGRSRDKDESSEVDRWKKAAESESARADRAEARATALESELAGEQLAANSWKSKAEQNAKAASDWESTAKASSARVADLARDISALRAGLPRVAAVNLLARLLHESGRQAVKRGENIAQESTFIEWAALPARVKQGRTMTASAMLDSVLIAAAPAPAGSTRLSGACLARQIHKCEKAAIESGHTARQHSTTWIPFDELPEAAMKGRLAQAEFLENTCDLAFFVWDK